MKIFNLLIILTLLSACEGRPVTYEQRPIKWCIDICISDHIEGFHNGGHSWGTSSSTLQQTEIFKQLHSYCSDIYVKGYCYQVKGITVNYLHRHGIKEVSPINLEDYQ